MLKLLQGDITKLAVDAIVNAANSSLMGGGGIDGANHKAGGPLIWEDCRKILAKQGSCKTGEAVITTAGNLPAKYVRHTVGLVCNGGKKGEAQLLANAYLNCLRLAAENEMASVAFPNISTSIYRFPKQKAAEMAVAAVKTFLQGNTFVEEVFFVCFDEENYLLYKKLLDI